MIGSEYVNKESSSIEKECWSWHCRKGLTDAAVQKSKLITEIIELQDALALPDGEEKEFAVKNEASDCFMVLNSLYFILGISEAHVIKSRPKLSQVCNSLETSNPNALYMALTYIQNLLCNYDYTVENLLRNALNKVNDRDLRPSLKESCFYVRDNTINPLRSVSKHYSYKDAVKDLESRVLDNIGIQNHKSDIEIYQVVFSTRENNE